MNDTLKFMGNNKTFGAGVAICDVLDEVSTSLEFYEMSLKREKFDKLSEREMNTIREQILSMNYKLMVMWHESVKVYRDFENKREELR